MQGAAVVEHLDDLEDRALRIGLILLDVESLRHTNIFEEMAIIYMIVFLHRELAEGFEPYFRPNSYWLARSESLRDEEPVAPAHQPYH